MKDRTHCKNGHLWVPENLIEKKSGDGKPYFTCNICLVAAKRRSYDAILAKKNAAGLTSKGTPRQQPGKTTFETVGALLEQHRVITDSGCWEWTRGRSQDGYGTVSIDGKNHHVHAVAAQTIKSQNEKARPGYCITVITRHASIQVISTMVTRPRMLVIP
jgi:hypothetical protein